MPAASAASRPQPVDDEPVEEVRGGTEGLIDKAAGGESLADAEVDQLTEYFLGENRVRPGEAKDDTKTLAVNLAPTGPPVETQFTLHSISWEMWQTCQRSGTDRQRGEDVVNQFKVASYAVAFATSKPDLGAIRTRIPEDQRPKDTAELLRDFFASQPGSLIDLQSEVLKLSRLSMTESAVREVDTSGN